MEEWDRYCGITKSAREILSSLDPAPVIEAVASSEKPAAYPEVIATVLNDYTDSLKEAYAQSIAFHTILERLNRGKEGIVSASKKLNEQCASLLKQRVSLVTLNSAVQSKYFYYIHLENLEGQAICLARDSTAFKKKYLEVFAQIEDAIEFFTAHPHYIESNYYRNEYESLLDMWNSTLTSTLSESFQMFYTYYDNFFKVVLGSEEICKIFKQFVIGPSKFSDSNYILNLIISAYFKIRGKHVRAVLADTIEAVNSEKSVLKQCEASCEVLDRFWKKEMKLFIHYFSEDFPKDSLKVFFLSYSDPIYERIRENLIQEHNVQTLSLTSSLLQSFTKQNEISVFSRLLEDVQEKIVYAATLYINENIKERRTMETRKNRESEENWHPAVQKTMGLLKILHLNVNNEIFESLATEAIQACVSALKISTNTEDFIEIHEFLISNLLAIRKSIEELGVELKGQQYKQLDFTDTKRLFWKMVMGEVSLRKKGVFTELVSSGVPKFSQKDDKSLESEISAACQSFILKTFHEIANPILVLIVKSKDSGKISYENAEKSLEESTNRITAIFPKFCHSVFLLMDEKSYLEMTESVSAQILKAFQQLISFMQQSFKDMPVPLIEDIQGLLKNSVLAG